VTVQRKILLLLKSLQQRLGMSLLLISHDLNLVRSIAQRVCVMQAGEIVEQARAKRCSPRRSILTAACCSTPSRKARPCPGRARERAGGRRSEGLVPVGGGCSSASNTSSGGRHQPPESSAARPWASSASRLGKSTLGQAILRLIDSEAASAFRASPRWADQKQMRPWRRQMQVVFQDPFGSLSPHVGGADHQRRPGGALPVQR
jgi:microcin C transport system ATP-binding protein